MSPELLALLLHTVLPIAATLAISILHSRGVNLPILSAILDALGHKTSPPVPVVPPPPVVAPHIGDGHLLAALLAAMSGKPAPDGKPSPLSALTPEMLAALLALLQPSKP